jgi:hypothetical protein
MVTICFEVLTTGKGYAVSTLVMMELRLRSGVTSALEGGEWLTRALDPLPSGRRPWLALNMSSCAPESV